MLSPAFNLGSIPNWGISRRHAASVAIRHYGVSRLREMLLRVVQAGTKPVA